MAEIILKGWDYESLDRFDYIMNGYFEYEESDAMKPMEVLLRQA